MTGWQTGRAHVELLIDKGWLEPVRASGDLATRLLHESEAHLRTARAARDSDPTGRPTHPDRLCAPVWGVVAARSTSSSHQSGLT